ncbi:ATP-binding protein [Sciscionella sediminilitoris]|uniref:ATP-binding protein n=1 Tax=Sciscionella sediminilitoris TaxID=1445613 RepID=UPI0004DFC6AC|nr:LuxR family transcriptional regulator [Sciscionella sp. SE31]
MIERDDRLASIGTAIARVQSGHGELVLIRGGFGTGRSALLHAAGEEATAQGLRVVWTVTTPPEREIDYGLARLLLNPLREAGLSGELPEQARLDQPVSAMPVSPQHAHLVLHELLGVITEAASHGGPLALLVDDLQWADAASLRWLAYLANRIARLPVLLVVTLQDGADSSEEMVLEDLVRTAGRRLHATALSVDAVHTYLAARCPEAPERVFTEACHARTGGLPALLDALVGAMAEQGLRPVADSVTELAALRPASAATRLARCLDAQPAGVGTVAKAMAALGEETEAEVIGEVVGLDRPDLDAVQHALRRLALVQEPAADGRLRFRGTLTGELIAERLTAAEQDGLHFRAAKVHYRLGRPVQQVARELLATIAEPRPWAAGVLRIAARVALAEGEPRVAAQYLRHALAHPDSDRAELLVDLARVERRHDLPAARRHLHQALEMLGSPVSRASALCVLPVLAGPEPASDAEPIRRCLGELRGCRGRGTAEAALRLEARLRYLERDTPGAGPEAAERLAELGPEPAGKSSAQRELVAVLVYLAATTSAIPRESAVALAQQVLAREPGSPEQMYTALPLLVPLLTQADAIEGVESWLAAACGPEDTPDVPNAVAWTGQVLLAHAAGRFGEARERALAVLTVEPSARSRLTSVVLWVLTEIVVERRTPELARRIIEYCEPDQDPWLRSLTHGGLALAEGNLVLALEYFQDCAHQLESAGCTRVALPPVRGRIATLLAATEQPEQAEAIAQEVVARSMSWGATAAIGRALRIRAALLDRDEDAVPLLREAAEMLEGSADRLELARVLLLLGERETGARARECLKRGQRLAAECDAQWLLRPDGVELVPSGSLTATEQRVVELAVAGGRNREIAEQLAVSVRAVEKHLTSAYRKLGISSRAQLAQALSGHRAG